MMDGISISFWNVKGLHCPFFGCKLNIDDFVEKIQRCHISIVGETWGCKHYHNIADYKLIEIKPNKREEAKSGRASGGITIWFNPKQAGLFRI